MQYQTNVNVILRSSIALALALAICSPIQARSAESADGKAMTMATMTDHCQKMNAEMQKMRKDMKAHDAGLTEQVARMNSASEDKKMGLMAAVITHMVEMRIDMDARKAKMEDEMMTHMMDHMQMGKDSMSQCPMMKGMTEHSGDAHKGHQGNQR